MRSGRDQKHHSSERKTERSKQPSSNILAKAAPSFLKGERKAEEKRSLNILQAFPRVQKILNSVPERQDRLTDNGTVSHSAADDWVLALRAIGGARRQFRSQGRNLP
jgi:hypothetical protein